MVRDWAINKEVDAAHMLSPMPLFITLGAGSKKVPYFMPAVENIGGVHPDQDVQIRVVPPPEMVANLKAENVDGFRSWKVCLRSDGKRCSASFEMSTCALRQGNSSP